MAKILYTPAVLVNQREMFFLDKDKYDSTEVPSKIQKAELDRFMRVLEGMDIEYTLHYKDTITTVTPKKPIEYEFGEKKMTVKVAQFLNHTFEVIY